MHMHINAHTFVTHELYAATRPTRATPTVSESDTPPSALANHKILTRLATCTQTTTNCYHKRMINNNRLLGLRLEVSAE